MPKVKIKVNIKTAMFIFFLFRAIFHNNLTICILHCMLGEPLCHFFFHPVIHFFEFRTVICVVTSFRAHHFLLLLLLQAACYQRKFHGK